VHGVVLTVGSGLWSFLSQGPLTDNTYRRRHVRCHDLYRSVRQVRS